MISIIVPIYNCSEYIEELIKTFNDQTSHNFEVIFNNDCSTDNSYEVLLKNLESAEFRYTVLQNERNSGPGITRNRCIEEATGEYITFVDSDDYIDSRTVEIICDTAENNDMPDAIFFDYCRVMENKKIHGNTIEKCDGGLISKNDAFIYSLGSTCGKAYKTSIIKKNNVKFPDLRKKEDFVFNKIAITKCNTFYYIKEYLYGYRFNASSITNTNISLETPQKAFEYLYDAIGQEYSDIIDIIANRDLLYNLIQAKIRTNKITSDIKQYIDEYEAKKPNWYLDYKRNSYNQYTDLCMYFIKKRYIFLLRGTIYAKDMIKRYLTRNVK